MTPFSLFKLNMQFASLVVEAQTVITLRVMGMSGAIPTPHGESARMLNEKPRAMIDAYAAGTKAALAGQRPDQIMAATLTPLGHKVRANRKRLMR